MIAGLEEPTSGRIWMGEEELTAVSVQERRVGFVFQHYALFRHMTVAENVAFGLDVRKESKKDTRARVDELLELVQLAHYRERYPDQLSGGQRQRVALARALAPRPQVLLLDEPFGALDARVRQDLRRWLDELHRELGVTSLLVTHDQEEALELANRIVVMHEGRIEQVGSPDEIYDAPATSFVAGFVGSANVLHGGYRRPRAPRGHAGAGCRPPRGGIGRHRLRPPARHPRRSAGRGCVRLYRAVASLGWLVRGSASGSRAANLWSRMCRTTSSTGSAKATPSRSIFATRRRSSPRNTICRGGSRVHHLNFDRLTEGTLRLVRAETPGLRRDRPYAFHLPFEPS